MGHGDVDAQPWPAKHHATVTKTATPFKRTVTSHGKRTCFEAGIERIGREPLVERFGAIPLKRHMNAAAFDRVSSGPRYPVKKLVKRLRAGKCELCQHVDRAVNHDPRSTDTLSGSTLVFDHDRRVGAAGVSDRQRHREAVAPLYQTAGVRVAPPDAVAPVAHSGDGVSDAARIRELERELREARQEADFQKRIDGPLRVRTGAQ